MAQKASAAEDRKKKSGELWKAGFTIFRWKSTMQT